MRLCVVELVQEISKTSSEIAGENKITLGASTFLDRKYFLNRNPRGMKNLFSMKTRSSERLKRLRDWLYRSDPGFVSEVLECLFLEDAQGETRLEKAEEICARRQLLIDIERRDHVSDHSSFCVLASIVGSEFLTQMMDESPVVEYSYPGSISKISKRKTRDRRI